MTKFESDLVTPTDVPKGYPDLLDTWFDQNSAEFAQDWADYLEAIFDPDSERFIIVTV